MGVTGSVTLPSVGLQLAEAVRVCAARPRSSPTCS